MIKAILGVAVLAGTMSGQVFSNSTLSGKYFVRHVQFTTDANNNATDARSITGFMTLDGNGNYAFQGQQVIGTGAAADYAISGTYSLQPSGTLTITNPQTSTETINARYSTEAVIGSSTEAAGNTFDLFAAIPAPMAGFSDASLSVSYVFADFELTDASTAQVRNAVGGFQFDGKGDIQITKLLGHGASIAGGATQNQSGYSGTYAVNGDGSGTMTFQIPSGQSAANSLMASGARNLAVSLTGNVFIASTPGAHDILIGLHDAATDNITISNFTGRYWTASLETDAGGPSKTDVGSITVIAQDSAAIVAQREHQSSLPNQVDITSAGYYSYGTAQTGNVLISVGSSVITLGNNSTFIAADVGEDEATQQPSGQGSFNISLGFRVPTLTGSGVFVNPQGIINAAGNAPVGNPISPGEFIAIYGSGLAARTVSTTYPYPTSLGNVSVSIGGLPAPLQLVSGTQINCLVPYEVSTTSGPLPIIVTNNSTPSNTVLAPIAPTAPGIFSDDLTGAGEGAVTHNTTGAIVSSTNPAVAGETLVIYLTGLGALLNPIQDGQAPNPEGPDNSVIFSQGQVRVQVDGVSSPNVYYAGINPVYPGLYQIDFAMPEVPDHGQDVNLLVVAGTAGTEEVTLFAQ